MRTILFLAAALATAMLPTVSIAGDLSGYPLVETLDPGDRMPVSHGEGLATRNIEAGDAAAALKALGNFGSAADADIEDFASAAQGALADGALQADSNLADLDDAVGARGNLGAGVIGDQVFVAEDTTAAQKAIGVMVDIPSTVDIDLNYPAVNGDTFSIGPCIFTFVSGTPASWLEVQTGATPLVQRVRIADAIDNSPSCGVTSDYSPAYGAVPFTLTAIVPGSAGDLIEVSATGTSITFSGASLAGGIDNVAAYLSSDILAMPEAIDDPSDAELSGYEYLPYQVDDDLDNGTEPLQGRLRIDDILRFMQESSSLSNAMREHMSGPDTARPAKAVWTVTDHSAITTGSPAGQIGSTNLSWETAPGTPGECQIGADEIEDAANLAECINETDGLGVSAYAVGVKVFIEASTPGAAGNGIYIDSGNGFVTNTDNTEYMYGGKDAGAAYVPMQMFEGSGGSGRPVCTSWSRMALYTDYGSNESQLCNGIAWVTIGSFTP